MNKISKNLLLIGPIPEPKGGVSIHISRLKNLLKFDFNIKYVDESPICKPAIFNLRSKRVLEYFNLVIWADVVHIHSGVTLLRLAHLLAAKMLCRKTIVTLHAFPFNEGFQIAINKYLLKLADHIIVVNKAIPEILGINKYNIRPAFIPPDQERESPLPLKIEDWICDQKKNNNTILAANAFRIDLHNGLDLYGIDLCIDAIDILINKHRLDFKLIFVLASLSKSLELFKRYQLLINEKGLKDHILLLQENLSFVKLIEKCDIILRPTCTDGDALTVREAIFLGKPIIASDVVPRPVGTILFRNRDADSLASKILETTYTKQLGTSKGEPLSEYIEFYMNLYLN